MIVDDQVTSRLLLTGALQELGFKQISVTKDGKEAFAILLRSFHHLIVSDFNMPNMDGLDLLRAVRENPNTKKRHSSF